MSWGPWVMFSCDITIITVAAEEGKISVRFECTVRNNRLQVFIVYILGHVIANATTVNAVSICIEPSELCSVCLQWGWAQWLWTQTCPPARNSSWACPAHTASPSPSPSSWSWTPRPYACTSSSSCCSATATYSSRNRLPLLLTFVEWYICDQLVKSPCHVMSKSAKVF